MAPSRLHRVALRLRGRGVEASWALRSMLAGLRGATPHRDLANEAAASLRAEGVWVSSIERLLGDAAPAYRRSMADAAALLERPLHGAGATWHARGASIDLAPADLLAQLPRLFLFGLEPAVLAIAEHYLRLPVAYHGAVLRHSLVDGNAVGPRLWHRDAEDRHVLRCVVYLNDVDADGGPFEYVPRSDLGAGARRALSRGNMYSCAELASSMPRERWKRVLGGAGTVVMADSAQVFHHESLQRRTARSVVMMGHASRRPLDRALAESHFPAHHHLAALGRITRPEHDPHVFGWRGLAAPRDPWRAPNVSNVSNVPNVPGAPGVPAADSGFG